LVNALQTELGREGRRKARSDDQTLSDELDFTSPSSFRFKSKGKGYALLLFILK